MKRLFTLVSLFIFIHTNAQVFWQEGFGTGCDAGQLANAAVFTPTNGLWTITSLATGPGNGANANEWFVSAAENGNAVGTCGTGCGTNRTLHVGANLAPLFVDPGAAYLAGAANFNTNKRAESPTINCTGQTGITLNLKYIVDGVPGVDFAEVVYSANNGGTWSVLGIPAPVIICGGGQGTWTNFSAALPGSANNNPNVKIGFRWQSSDPTGSDPSIAVDDIQLAVAANLSVTTSPTVCSNQNIPATLTGTTPGTTAFTWTTIPGTAVISGTTPTGTTAIINYPAPGTYDLIVVGFVGLVPTYTAAQNVTVNATPTLAIPNQTICVGGVATLDALNPGASYQWAQVSPVPALLGTSQTQTVSPAVNSVYGVSVSLAGCSSTAQVNVNIGAYVPGATATPTAVCPGSPVTLNATAANSYTWVAPPSNTISNIQNPSVSPTVATTYTLFATSGACSGSVTVSVAMSAGLPPLVVASNVSSVCVGQTANLSALGATNYTWGPGATLNTTSGANVIASPTVNTTYTVIGESSGCVSPTASITVNIGTQPPMIVSATALSVCAGFNSTISALGANSYTWTGTGIGAPILQPSISVGPGTYTVNGTNGSSCNGFSVITVFTLAPLNIQVSQTNPTICIVSNNPQFSSPDTLNVSGASNYVWSPWNPSVMSNSLGAQIIVRPPGPTCFTVTGNSAVCSGSAVICVTVIPQFTIGVTPPKPIMCLGDSLGLCITNVGTLAAGPASAHTYSWTEPANAPPPSIINPLLKCVTMYPSNTVTPVTYTVEVGDSRGCISLPRLITVTVLPRPLISVAHPTINGLATSTVCFVGNSPGAPDVNLTLTATNLNNGLPLGVNPTFTWVPPYTGPNPILTPNPGVGSGFPPQHQIIVSAPKRLPSIQIYTVLTGYNGVPGCKETETIAITAVDCRSVSAISFSTSLPKDTLCTGDCISFDNYTDTLAGGPQTYTWTFPGGNPATSNLKNPTICYNLPPPPGQAGYNVVLRVCNPYPIASGGSCLVRGLANYITVVDRPNVIIVPPGGYRSYDTLPFGATKTFTASGAKFYEWSANNYFLPPPVNQSSITVTKITQPTRIIVRGWNAYSTIYGTGYCDGSDTLFIHVSDDCGEMFVPNAFSPNGDGMNDILNVKGKCLSDMTFMIFNRWGEKVFESRDFERGWDGTYKGELLNTAVFVYRLEGKTYDGKTFSAKGNISLIR